MTEFLLILLALTCVGLLLWGFQKPQRMLHYPFLASAVFLGWAFPQLWGLSQNLDRFPAGALDKTIFMTLLCLGACYVGHYCNRRPLQLFNHCSFDRQRLLTTATLWSLGGAYFFYRVSLLADDAGTRWSGIITIFVFFSGLLTTGMVIALVTHVRQPSFWSWTIVVFDLAFYIHRIVFLGRRRYLIELGLMIGLALWFRYRKMPPRSVVVAALLLVMLWINSIGEYRAIVKNNQAQDFGDITQIDFIGNLRRLSTEGGHEFEAATYAIEAFDRQSNFDFGVSQWNKFVHLYIPGQLIGAKNKENLKVAIENSAHSEFYYDAKTGVSGTGMADAFKSFWYFGAASFCIIAFVTRKLFRAADKNSLVAQILLMLVLPSTLLAITHGTDRFYLLWPKLILFLGPAIWYSRIPKAKY